MLYKRLPFLFFLLALWGCGSSGTSPLPSSSTRQYALASLQTTTVTLNGSPIAAWVMDTGGKRAEGMMLLSDREVKSTEGMLFVFANPSVLNFYMKDTIIPLDIAYLDEKRKIVRIARLKPRDETPVSSVKPAKYALEVKEGVLDALSVEEGMTLQFDPSLVSHD